MTFISIIIPFNKGKRYLKECLESIDEQNLKDYETILVLNGIEEEINDLIEEYEDKISLKIIEFKEEIGVAKARNEAIKIATGDYLYFIDSDDYIYSKGLKKLVEISEESNFDIITGEKLLTYYIKERFEEKLAKTELTQQNGYSNEEFGLKLIVGDKTKRIELLSALHLLIKKEIIEKNNITFDESKRYNSDYSFVLDVIENSNSIKGVENAIYSQRIRDDPINLKSLNQELSEEESLSNFTKEYTNTIEKIESWNDKNKSNFLKDEISNKVLNYYLNIYSSKFRKNDEIAIKYFNEMSEIAKTFNKNSMNSKIKKEINSLIQKDKKTLLKYAKKRLLIKKIKEIKEKHWMLYSTLYLNYFNKKEINKKQIIFESFRGDYYTDSPKYIYEYLYKNFKDDFDFVWVINDKNTKIPGNPKKVKRFSLEFFKEVARSKYWVINGRQDFRLLKRKEQVILSTWHGTPLKKLGLDIENIYSGSPKIKHTYIKNASEWKYLVSPNKYTTDILRSCFAYDGEIIETGYPRNDILYNATSDKVNKIKDGLKLPKDKKIILYAPTWRDDEFYDLGQYKFTLKLELDKLKESLSDEYIILIRTHYFIADKLDLTEYKGFAFDVCKYDDIAELYLISDLLITDYSSVFFDFANLKRPILFYTYDLDKYENVLRGFYIDIKKEVPGPLLFTTEEVIDSIKKIDSVNEEYSEKYNKFYNRFCNIDDGHASERIVKKVWNK